MALKAGTVGIDPKYVDKNGKPVSDVDLSNYYTKSETDTKLDLKANKSYLTANNKIFNFAYDAESGKYGYKAGAQDDFHPFEQAGGAGWNAPADLITTGLSYSKLSHVAGGYYNDTDNHICYIDVVLQKTESGTGYMLGLPRGTSNNLYALANVSDSDNTDNYIGTNAFPVTIQTASTSGVEGISSNANTYVHIFGEYSTS